ncbi:Na/Pi cotransporter family protein [Lachnospiraceae bacterium LCP25S3_G4]
MKTDEILMLIGGLALFLYGMQEMSSGLEGAAADKMKALLERFTSNRFKGVLVGAIITAIIQSSSATTVMVVGFVNSGLMTLNQAVWIIMGANIGTTITGQLIAMDIGAIAPVIAFVGVAIVMFAKKQRIHYIGEIIAGLGILFVGMEMMGNSMASLQNSPQFISVISNFDSPFVGILAGAIFTAVIQSSSASVGILQALVGNHVLGFSHAVFVLFGQNIGTCITAVLAAIGAKTAAKRTTIIHLMFNIFGTLVFTFLCLTTPLSMIVENFSPNNPIAQVANMHTLFNVVTTLLLLPFGNYMVKIATKILPGKKEEADEVQQLEFITPIDPRAYHKLGQVTVTLTQIGLEIQRMHRFAWKNINNSFDIVKNYHEEMYQKIVEQEEYLDYMNAKISVCIGQVATMPMTEQESLEITAYYGIIGNFERVGDHAMNIAGYAKSLHHKKLELSKEAIKEVKVMKTVSLQLLESIELPNGMLDQLRLEETRDLEQKTDELNAQFRKKQLSRLKSGGCVAETSVLYSEMLTDFERIGDHVLNIAESYHSIAVGKREVL